ncbi:tetratricopeptide repeat-containing sensor histidine kinase [Flavobacterium reichenbachii]|uniref:histidine kinase n=1 Tax=Flavobacterium reichenbachii TaxID=362418 RepID=A0A085ZCR1_9FLAO|nr:tetratricopeptide repeat-containing sensor histidine kinase [Flavobacterium reichenbachii]KFF02225.1 histidine kinase [Flavobacterium reichenbachii]OXB09739.1 two-component sensor histidine kinase [Flavobacterium reichenbachii]
MALWFRKPYLLIFIFLSFGLKAQIENKKRIPVTANSLEIKGDKNILLLYDLYNKGEEKKAYKKAHFILKSGSNNRSSARANLLLAYYFNKRAIIDSSIYYTNQALKFNTVVNDSLKNRLFSLGYNLLAINYKKRGLLNESKKWHLKGIEVSQKYNETNLYYTHIHGLALAYSELGDYQNALKLFKQCLDYKDDNEIILGSCINLGDIYSRLKDYESANIFYKKGKILCEKTNNNQGKAIILLGLGENYQLLNKQHEALKMFQEASLIADKNELNQLSITARSSIGDIYISLKKYNEAKVIFSEALQKSIHFGLLQNQNYIYDELKKIAIQQDDFKSAYSFFEKSTQIKDSINKLQKIKEINELEIKYKTAQKQKEIETLQFENEAKKLTLDNQEEAIKNMLLQEEISKKNSENAILAFQNSSNKKRNEISLLKKDQQFKDLEINQQKKTKMYTIIGFLILLIPIIGLLFQYYKRLNFQKLVNAKQVEINQQEIEGILKEQELELIKASISGQDNERERISQELHDSIGGNLAAIKLQLNHLNSSNFSNIQKISLQLDETYEQVRSLSHTLLPKKFSQNKFLEVLESYLKNISQASKIKIALLPYPKNEINDLNEEIQIEIFKIIQELLTNTIKHAKASEVEIQLNHIENSMNVLFEDKGIGFETEKYTKGIGFINLETRITKLNGSFLIDSKIDRGTIINIEIPVLFTKSEKKLKSVDLKNQLDKLKSN